MTVSSDISVKLDDRVRLMSAALAATRYPDQAQGAATARDARPRPRDTQSCSSITKTMMPSARCKRCSTKARRSKRSSRWRWCCVSPKRRSRSRRAGCRRTGTSSFAAFTARRNSRTGGTKKMLRGRNRSPTRRKCSRTSSLSRSSSRTLGEIKERLVFIPNICYPTDHELGLRIGSDLVCIAPPRLAWGDSPPWPYDEDPAHIYRAALGQYGRLLMVAYLREHAAADHRDCADIAAGHRPVSRRSIRRGRSSLPICSWRARWRSTLRITSVRRKPTPTC